MIVLLSILISLLLFGIIFAFVTGYWAALFPKSATVKTLEPVILQGRSRGYKEWTLDKVTVDIWPSQCRVRVGNQSFSLIGKDSTQLNVLADKRIRQDKKADKMKNINALRTTLQLDAPKQLPIGVSLELADLERRVEALRARH